MKFNGSALLLSALLLTSCAKKDSTATTTTSTLPALAGAINSVSEGVQAVGDGMEVSQEVATQGLSEDEVSTFALTPMQSSLCTAHGEPAGAGGVGYMQTSDPQYPFVHTYCAMTVADGDTVRGGFDLAQSLICSLEKGGIQFNNVPQTIAVSFNDTLCWPDGGPDGTTASISLSATGSAPASFNSHFEKGVIFTVAELGLTFKIAANITSSNIEFIAHENWTDGNTGVMAGALNKSTGVLQYEKRDERIKVGCSGGSCGWNRHSRIHANLAMSASGHPTGLNSLSYGYSDVQAANPTGSTAASGKLITAQGSLSTGIKARLFGAPQNTTTVSTVSTPGAWTEQSGSTGCMTHAGYDSANCTSETGVGLFTANPASFVLLGTHAAPAAWLAAFSGFSFTTVDVNVD